MSEVSPRSSSLSPTLYLIISPKSLFQDRDPETLAKLERDVEMCKNAANRWTVSTTS